MKKGSIVQLKEEVVIDLETYFSSLLFSHPLLRHDIPYVLSTDPMEYTCCRCGDTHYAVELEELPGFSWKGDCFYEVLAPEEVRPEELFI